MGLSAAAILRLEAIARQRGMSRAEAAAEAIRDWTTRGEASLNRDRRLSLEKAMRRAMDRAPLEELMKDFGGDSDNIRPGGLFPSTPNARFVTVQTLTLAERRKALGFSQQKLAEIAGCSMGTIRLLEGGYTPSQSEKAEAIEQALVEAERETS